MGYFETDPEPNFNFDSDPFFLFGKTYVVLRRASLSTPPSTWEVLQGWVSVINSAQGRYSVGQRAIRLDSACDPGPIDPAPEDFFP